MKNIRIGQKNNETRLNSQTLLQITIVGPKNMAPIGGRKYKKRHIKVIFTPAP